MNAYNTVLIALLGNLLLVGCQSEPGNQGGNTAIYSIGGTLSGLAPAQTVTLQNNAGDDLVLGADGAFSFATEINDGAGYQVSVSLQPAGQTCTASANTGVVNGANVTSVTVNCSTVTFSLGGNLSGLASATTVELTNNGGDLLILNVNGAFDFATELADGAGYNVQVSAQPATQQCVLSNNLGTVAGADVANINLACSVATVSGSLDSSFNTLGVTPGIATNDPDDPSVGGDIAHDIAIDSLGRIVAAGEGLVGNTTLSMVIWRYSADGALDLGFDGDGIAAHRTVAGVSNDQGFDMTLDASGRILVTGQTKPAQFLDMATWRFNIDGSIDTSFNVSGFVTHDNAAGGGLNDVGKGIAVDSLGNVVVAGDSHNGSNIDMAIWRYTSSGVLDSSFDGDGIVVQGPATQGDWDDQAYAVAIDASDRILVTGHSITDTSIAMVIWRYNSDGTLDTTFNAAGAIPGIATYDTTTNNGLDIVLDGSGRILVSGFTASGSNSDLAVWRFLADGTLDTSFAAGGFTPGMANIAISSTGTRADRGFALTLDASNRILVTGFNDNSGTSNDMILVRLTADGEVDSTFNPGGVIPGVLTYHNAAGGNLSDQGYGIAVDSSGKIVVGGNSTNTDGNPDMTLWRFNP